MTTSLTELLQQKFGYSSFRPGQREAVESVLQQRDTLVMLPTGTGKSLCYQLPAYIFEGLTLIVSPLLSLMQDQVENLRLRGEKRVVALNSLTPYSERKRIFKHINQYRFIYTSPEMLQNNEVMTHLKRAKVSLFVVDEAHCISHWGTDFRPDYLALAQVRKQLDNPTTMALTATATKQVRQEIIRFLGLTIQETTQITQSVDRPEIKYMVELCKGDKLEKIIEYIRKINGAGIIYFMSKKLANQTAEILRKQYHIRAESYHSDIDGDDKIKIQQQFLENNIQVICATSAFGMGFDKEDIRYVIHYHLPDSPEMYLQEVGRASRDGKNGLAILLYQYGDEQIQKRFLEESLPTKEILQMVAKHPQKYINGDDAVYKLAHYFIQSHASIEQALVSISTRKEIRMKQIDYMVRYIHTEKCKRDFLLTYFNEQKAAKQNVCCVNCEIDLTALIEEMNELSSHTYDNLLPVRSWKETLKSMYNIG